MLDIYYHSFIKKANQSFLGFSMTFVRPIISSRKSQFQETVESFSQSETTFAGISKLPLYSEILAYAVNVVCGTL